MAAENIDNTPNGDGLFNTKIPGLSDAADIQAALRLYHYGSYTYDGANTDPSVLLTPSIAKHLQTLVDADAAEVVNRNSAISTHNADTTNVHGIANTEDLATIQYVDTEITDAISGAVGGYPDLAGTALEWNTIDERFDVEPRLANTGTIITKTESFTLSAEDVGKTAILYSSSPMTVTLPANASVEIPVGYSIDIVQTGTGSVTVSEGTVDVSINSKSSIKSLDGQYSKGTLVKIDTNTWFFFGNLLNTVVPTPVAPTPVSPTPIAPTPVAPTPVAPVAPTPVAPTPVAPVAPTPVYVAPTPVAPVAPTPVAPTPVAPAYGTVYVAYCLAGQPYAESYPVDENNILTQNINEACAVYTSVLEGSGASSISCSISSPQTEPLCSTPTPVAPTPTATIYYAYGCCAGDPWVIDGPSNQTARADYQFATGCVATGVKTNYAEALAAAQTGDCATAPTPVYVAPTPTAPTPVASNCSDFSILNQSQCSGCGGYWSVNFGECSETPWTTPTPVAPTPVAPTPVAPTPTATIYYAYGCCAGDPWVIDGPSNQIARADYQFATGCTAAGVTTDYNTALAAAQTGDCATAPTPVYVAPTPVAPTPVYVAPTPVAPTPVAPTPVTEYCYCAAYGYAIPCSQYCPSGSPTPVYVAPTPVAPTPVAPVAPTPVAPTPVAPVACGSISTQAGCICEGGLWRSGGCMI